MKNKKTKKPNLVKLSLEELKGINGGATSTLDEKSWKPLTSEVSATAPEVNNKM